MTSEPGLFYVAAEGYIHNAAFGVSSKSFVYRSICSSGAVAGLWEQDSGWYWSSFGITIQNTLEHIIHVFEWDSHSR